MKKKVTMDTIWASIQKEPSFRKLSEQVREAYRPFVQAIPRLVGRLVEQPVTLVTLMKARQVYLQHGNDGGLVEAVISATPNDELGRFSRDDLIEMYSGILVDQIEEAREGAHDPDILALRNGLTEEGYLLEVANLNQDALTRYRTGDLTIGELLLINPATIALLVE